MRTGQFATQHKVSASTVGFYLKAGLLTPRLAGGKYDFGPDDSADMEMILLLKDWRFSLEEIADILSERRLEKDSVKPRQTRFLSMLEARRQALEDEIQRLRTSMDTLTQTIQTMHGLAPSSDKNTSSGIDVRFLPLFFCPLCHTQLSVRLDCIRDGQFSAGELTCSCGYRATVSQGVLENPALNQTAQPRMSSDPFSLMTASAEMQNCQYRMHAHLSDMMDAVGLSRKIVIETHTGYSSFLLQKARALSDSALYICCDPRRDVLMEEKRCMDGLACPLPVLFLASNNQRFPLRSGCAHFLVSCLQSMFFTDAKGGFPFHRWVHYLEPGGRIVGAFVDISSGAATVRRFAHDYPHALPEYYDYRAFRNSLLENGFVVEDERDAGTVTSSQYAWHKEGDELKFRCYCARMKKR